MRFNKIFLVIISAAILVSGILFLNSRKNIPESGNTKSTVPEARKSNKNSESGDITYYYGKECPHCQDVSEFLEKNGIADKINFEKKEIWHDTGNNGKMLEAAKTCGLDESQIGVPFVFNGGKCFMGTPEVVNFFKSEAGL